MTVSDHATSDRSLDRWIDIALRATAVALVLAVGFFVFTVATGERRQEQDTPAARAVANLLKVVEEDPENITARLTLADALKAAGRWDEAREQYSVVLAADPENAGAMSGLALLAMDEGDWAEAETYWRDIIGLIAAGPYASNDLRLEQAFYYLASTLMETQQYEDAAYYLREALRIRSDASDSHFLLAIAYRELGSDVKYREELDIALLFDPLMPEANYEKGLILLGEGELAKAAERFRVSLEGAPPWETRPLDELEKLGTADERAAEARQFQASGDARAALESARIAAAIDPDHLESLRLIGSLYEQRGAYKPALAAYQRILLLEPDAADAEAAVQRLEGLIE